MGLRPSFPALAWIALAACVRLPADVHGGGTVRLDPRGLGLEASTAAALTRAVESGDWAEAERLLFGATAQAPARPALQRALGIAHFQAGRHFLAAVALKHSDRLAPLDPPARHLLSSALIGTGRKHWARAELEALVEAEGDEPRYRYSLARVLHDQQRFEAALEQLRPALAGQPRFVEALDLAGQCWEGLGRTAAAEEAYLQAIAASADAQVPSPWPAYHLGSLLHDLGRLREAASALGQAVRAGPRNAPSRRELGIVLMKLGRHEQAAAALEAAADLVPGDAATQFALAQVYRRMGRGRSADEAIRRFEALRAPAGP